MNDQLRITVFHGNDILYPIDVKRHGVKGSVDVSAATAITLEWEDSSGVHQAVIPVLSTLVGADWANGIVMLPINSTNFTAAIGTYTFSLTLAIDSQIITTDIGVVEVRERPGYPSV